MLLINWFHKGGVFMWPLLACSILGLAAIIERLWTYRSLSINFEKFSLKLKNDLLASSTLKPPEWLSLYKGPVKDIAALYLESTHLPEKIRHDTLKREGNKRIAALEKRMKLISSLATVSPLLGLLGTVAGLVSAFYKIETLGGVVRPDDLAGGIWEALLTTVAGLSIGIPLLLMHQYFQSKIDITISQMEQIISELDEISYLISNPSDIKTTSEIRGMKTL